MKKGNKILALLLSISLITNAVSQSVYAANTDSVLRNGISIYNSDGGKMPGEYVVTIGEGSIADGKYADWKNNAITYPVKGQLVAAGYSDVMFNSLEHAIKYDVYVDDMLIRTIEGDEATADSYEVQFKDVKVAQHTAYVVATLENGDIVTSNIRNFYISKKGMGIWQSDVDKIKELNLSWYYTWSPYELDGAGENVQFVPMIWGDEADSRSVDRQNEWKWLRNGAWKDYRYLLMFNEPDFAEQSGISPERAVELWKDINPVCGDEDMDVGSPVVAVPTIYYPDENNEYKTKGGWYGKYEKLMAEAEYYDEFTAVHFYLDYPGEYVLDIISQIHEATGKPIWITEWGVAQWSQIQDFDWTGGKDEGNWQRQIIVDFLNEIIPQLDQLDYVERYAWFPFDGSNTEKYGNGAGGLFFCGEKDPLKGQLTTVGETYKEVGNPEGWNPDVVTEDRVVIDPEYAKETENNEDTGGIIDDENDNPNTSTENGESTETSGNGDENNDGANGEGKDDTLNGDDTHNEDGNNSGSGNSTENNCENEEENNTETEDNENESGEGTDNGNVTVDKTQNDNGENGNGKEDDEDVGDDSENITGSGNQTGDTQQTGNTETGAESDGNGDKTQPGNIETGAENDGIGDKTQPGNTENGTENDGSGDKTQTGNTENGTENDGSGDKTQPGNTENGESGDKTQTGNTGNESENGGAGSGNQIENGNDDSNSSEYVKGDVNQNSNTDNGDNMNGMNSGNGMSENANNTIQNGYTDNMNSVNGSGNIGSISAVNTVAAKVGDVFNDGTYLYQVTNLTASAREVEVIGLLNKTIRTIVIPATVIYEESTYKVTSIAAKAFINNSRLKGVTIGKNITFIGKKAFYNCKNLKKVTFKGNKVKIVGLKAFNKTNCKIKFKVGKRKNIKKYENVLKNRIPSAAQIIK